LSELQLTNTGNRNTRTTRTQGKLCLYLQFK